MDLSANLGIIMGIIIILCFNLKEHRGARAEGESVLPTGPPNLIASLATRGLRHRARSVGTLQDSSLFTALL